MVLAMAEPETEPGTPPRSGVSKLESLIKTSGLVDFWVLLLPAHHHRHHHRSISDISSFSGPCPALFSHICVSFLV